MRTIFTYNRRLGQAISASTAGATRGIRLNKASKLPCGCSFIQLKSKRKPRSSAILPSASGWTLSSHGLRH